MLLAAGCADTTTNDGSSRISDLEGQLATSNTNLAAERAAKAALEKQVAMGAQSNMESKGEMPAASSNDNLPPNPQAGHCYARVLIPATYKTENEQVETSAAGERVETLPAKYGTEKQRVVTQEESSRIEVIPATYKTVTERVMVQPERGGFQFEAQRYQANLI